MKRIILIALFIGLLFIPLTENVWDIIEKTIPCIAGISLIIFMFHDLLKQRNYGA